MTKTILGLLALQLSFGIVVFVAIMLSDADKRCDPPKATLPFKDCQPYPEGGPGAMVCTWISQSHPVFPWAPTGCESP